MLEPLQPADVDALHALWTTPAVRQSLTEIIASTEAPNERSVRLLERPGHYVRGEATRYYRLEP